MERCTKTDMVYNAWGDADAPVVVLLHGGGLAPWSCAPLAQQLCDKYRVLAPALDGHGARAEVPFTTMDVCARHVLDFIDAQCGGQVFALYGLSLGAQVAVQCLALRPALAQFAVIESALLEPMPAVAALAAPTYALCFPLIRQQWFARAQAKELFVPQAQFAQYFADTCAMQRASLVNIARENASFSLPAGIAQCEARVLAAAGEKELAAMRRSADALAVASPHGQAWHIPAAKHGQLSLTQPEVFAQRILSFFGEANS